TNSEQLAIFSEVYYSKGWNAYINDQPATYFRADYLLRAMSIPAGTNKIEFKFQPQVIEIGSNVSLGSSILLALIFAGGMYYKSRKKEIVTKTSSC
ncbi:MAG: YfhO family protein, partial [Flavobacteriales bacterium]